MRLVTPVEQSHEEAFPYPHHRRRPGVRRHRRDRCRPRGNPRERSVRFDLGPARAVRVRRQLGHQHRQRLLRRPAVQPRHLAGERWRWQPRLRQPRGPDRRRRARPRLAGLGCLARMLRPARTERHQRCGSRSGRAGARAGSGSGRAGRPAAGGSGSGPRRAGCPAAGRAEHHRVDAGPGSDHAEQAGPGQDERQDVHDRLG
ncbi:hypothetical protein CURTO8I2_10035 [Curtobacterium sp. 8I-2]|nr:hypothetical protein CURTO8I2_10035 [Curtobacterium sp. 8I-2]